MYHKIQISSQNLSYVTGFQGLILLCLFFFVFFFWCILLFFLLRLEHPEGWICAHYTCYKSYYYYYYYYYYYFKQEAEHEETVSELEDAMSRLHQQEQDLIEQQTLIHELQEQNKV